MKWLEEVQTANTQSIKASSKSNYGDLDIVHPGLSKWIAGEFNHKFGTKLSERELGQYAREYADWKDWQYDLLTKKIMEKFPEGWPQGKEEPQWVQDEVKKLDAL